MPKSYRFRTQVGVDREVRLNIEQDFDFLEILSLKLRQEDLYERFCADYGVVTGRVVANGGFGVPNVNVSIFVPLDNVDENNIIISTLYPYKNLKTKNEDGYRYNLLPYKKEYGGHTPTGTFPDRQDVLTRREVLQVYEKYYKYTVKTNSSGDFMIVGVPLGQQKLIMDLDLSNMGQFSLRPSDLIRMGMGVPSQFNGQQFKASEDLSSLPQIVNSVKEIDVTPFWGDNDLCNVGITRSDFDLRDLGIEIEPQSIFMGSVFSSTEDDFIRGNCKPKNDVGKLCDVVAGPGQILALRHTISVDAEGQPILEQHQLEDGGNIIDDSGTWMIDLPMNLDYIITNEFGEQIISLDPKVGIPTKGKYRFRVKWQNEGGMSNDIFRADYLIPNIREHGWSGTTTDEMPSEEIRNKSYAFSLDWDEYYDKTAAINCEDSFYEFTYNKVYTIASHYDRFKWGFNRIKHLGIKEINDKTCQSEHNPLPVIEAQRNGSVLIFLFNFILSILTIPLIALLAIAHIITFIWPVIRAIIIVISAIINFVIYAICRIIASIPFTNKSKDDCVKKEVTPPPKESPFSTINFPMLSYPDCEACACDTNKPQGEENDTASQLESYSDEVNFGPIIDATYTETFSKQTGAASVDNADCPEASDEVRLTQGRLMCAGYDQFSKNGYYTIQLKEQGSGIEDCDWDIARSFNRRDQVQWYKSPAYPVFFANQKRVRWKLGAQPTWAQSLNLLNRRKMYFGEAAVATNKLQYNNWDTSSEGEYPAPYDTIAWNKRTTTSIQAELINNQINGVTPQAPSSNFNRWMDNAFIMVLDPGDDMERGQLFFFNDPSKINDPNFITFPDGNQFDTNGITGTCENSTTGYINKPFSYMDRTGAVQNTTLQLYNTASTMSYNFKSGVEYFQCIRTFTFDEIWSLGDASSDAANTLFYKFTNGEPDGSASVKASSLVRYITDYYQQYGNNWQGEEMGYNSSISKRVDNDGGIADDIASSIKVVVAVRGVDPYMPRQRVRYDLSKLFGRGVASPDDEDLNIFNGAVTVTGDYFLNIPIQPNDVDMMNNPPWRYNDYSPIGHYRIWQGGTDEDQNKRNALWFHDCDNDGRRYDSSGNIAGYGFNTKLWHEPFLFTPDAELWESFETYCPNKYVSIDNQFTEIESGTFETFMGRVSDSAKRGVFIPSGNNDDYTGVNGGNLPGDNSKKFPKYGINPWYQRNIEGCGYQYSYTGGANSDNRKRQLRNNGNKELFAMSPLYLPKNYKDLDESDGVPKTFMNNSHKIIFRSDRIPSSDKFDSPDFKFFVSQKKLQFRRYALHMNLQQQLFLSDDNGTVVDIDGNVQPTDASGNYLDSIEDTNCETSLLLSTFNCGSMVSLGCYSGDGENFGVEVPCEVEDDERWDIEGDERVQNGCYVFVIKKPIKSLGADIKMLFEYRTRLRFMFAVCQGVIGESFQNNWLNGSLYMPSFQKQTIYNSDNEVKRYRYCGDPQQFFSKLRHQGPLYFNTNTNSFYYRSTPFNDTTNQFVGQEPSRDYYYGQNSKNLWSPTTIMELGPRDEFTKEIAFSPEFEGYIIDTLKTTTYQSPSGVVNLFILSRLVNTSFLEQILNNGDASVGQLFSRESGTVLGRLFDARVDGDFAQMVGINSEYGVVPFLEGNYCDNGITVQDDRFGIWFSSNTINRRILTNGTTTFGTEPEGPSNYFGYTDTQVVPYYMWNIKNNGLFGTEYNTWETDVVFSSQYQGDDFFNSTQPYMKPNIGYGRGHIFNANAFDPEYDSLPINNSNQNNFKVGSPFYFYFGLKRGKSAMNRYIKKYIFNLG